MARQRSPPAAQASVRPQQKQRPEGAEEPGSICAMVDVYSLATSIVSGASTSNGKSGGHGRPFLWKPRWKPHRGNLASGHPPQFNSKAVRVTVWRV